MQGQVEWFVGSWISLWLETLQPLWAPECLWTEMSQLNFHVDAEVLAAAQVLSTCPCSSSVKLFGCSTPSSESYFSAHTVKEDKKYIYDYQSGLQILFSIHTFQDAVNCPAALCEPLYLMVQLKILSKGDTHELNKSTAEEETILKVTVSSVQFSSIHMTQAPSSSSQLHICHMSNYRQRCQPMP